MDGGSNKQYILISAFVDDGGGDAGMVEVGTG